MCVSDFLRLEIVVYWDAVHVHGWVQDEGDVFRTVEDGLDLVGLEPFGAGRGLEVTEPESRNDFVCPIGWIRCHFRYRDDKSMIEVQIKL